MLTKKRRCPKCGHWKRADGFSCEWCDDCWGTATDNIMRAIGYIVVFCSQDLIDDAEEAWDAAWALAMELPKDYPDYASLCEVLSNIKSVQEYQ